MKEKTFYLMSPEETESYFNTNRHDGLTDKAVRQRLLKFGLNELTAEKKTPAWRNFIAQFANMMTMILIGAALISACLREYTDAITIMVIVLINATLGFVQEHRVERSLESLKNLASPTATVLRDGQQQKIPAKLLVPGDILLLEAGDKIAADCRLAAAEALEVEESLLTGEAFAVRKIAAALPEGKQSIADCLNMGFAGTTVARGRGIGIVCATGMTTEMGKIARGLQGDSINKTPLEERLEQLGKKLLLICSAVCAMVVLLGISKGEPLFIMCMTGISLAVAAIPEGLPAIVTIALALGVQRMIKKNAIVRKLAAVETLGCVNIICCDKTGTLTQNQMTVRQIATVDGCYDITGSGYDIHGGFNDQAGRRAAGDEQLLTKCLNIGVLCNNSALCVNDVEINGEWRGSDAAKAKWSIKGDPTEGALLVAAAKKNIWRRTLQSAYERVAEIPFDSTRSMMSVIVKNVNMNEYFIYTKGASDKLIDICNRYQDSSGVHYLTGTIAAGIKAQNAAMAGQAMRVLAVAYKPLSNISAGDHSSAERDLIFTGLIGMIDPPRQEVKPAIAACKKAGIKTVMITGDHPATAVAIGRELNLYDPRRDKVMNGAEIEKLSDEKLSAAIGDVTVFARVSPDNKLKIVRCLKQRGHVVAMTGDGVNDAPAVKAADIGIAMGRGGTDVTKEASAMILTDDNFATIVAAIEEGRSIYQNIRKFIRYLLACNLGEILTMFIASFINLPNPLLPVQILWVNLVTDGLPALALGVDKNDSSIMLDPPRPRRESIFARGLSAKIIMRGSQIALSTISVYLIGLTYWHDLELARTMALSTLVLGQLFHVFDCRSERFNAVETGLLNNRQLFAAVVLSALMQFAVVQTGYGNAVFSTSPLDLESWILVITVSGFTFFANAIKSLWQDRVVGNRVPSVGKTK